MTRWVPDARGRLIRSAMELYADPGFEQTTAADVAGRAGVSERTFFRHFADKREVLFDGSSELIEVAVGTVESAPASTPAFDLAAAAMLSAGRLLEDRRDHARRRAAVIAANPSLQERELLKLARLSGALAGALRARGVPDQTAALSAETGVAVFKVGFERWIAGAGPDGFTDCLREAQEQLRELT